MAGYQQHVGVLGQQGIYSTAQPGVCKKNSLGLHTLFSLIQGSGSTSLHQAGGEGNKSLHYLTRVWARPSGNNSVTWSKEQSRTRFPNTPREGEGVPIPSSQYNGLPGGRQN